MTDITREVQQWVSRNGCETGLLNLLLESGHTQPQTLGRENHVFRQRAGYVSLPVSTGPHRQCQTTASGSAFS